MVNKYLIYENIMIFCYKVIKPFQTSIFIKTTPMNGKKTFFINFSEINSTSWFSWFWVLHNLE